MFAVTFPVLNALNIMHLKTPQSAVLSAVIFNALIIIALIPLALRGVKYRAMNAEALLRRNLFIYGVGGLIAPFIGIKLIDMLITAAATGLRILMKKNLITAFLMTIATTILLGVLYPLVITGLAQVLFKDKANGQLRYAQRRSHRLAHHRPALHLAKYFHPRPSAAGNGYDAANSGGTNLAPTNQKLIDRVQADAKTLHDENPCAAHSSGSPHHFRFGPRSGNFPGSRRVSRFRAWLATRGLPESAVRDLVQKHTDQRDLGLLGEARVNVLELNLALDDLAAKP